MKFELQGVDGKARVGRLTLGHSVVETPTFMPVGTTGSVKTLVPSELVELDTRIILANTYHLFLRPGLEVIESFGGLHRFISWNGSILTDSGGFQVFSLSANNSLTEKGVTFRSHVDGRKVFLSPEKAVEIQEALGSDIQMVLDECTDYPATHEQAARSMERSMRWASRARSHRRRSDLAQFGIVQGGVYGDLRRESCEQLQDIGFEGYSIGGLSVGETKDEMHEMTTICCEQLPEGKPRYLMGVGTPLDLIEAVNRGVDMFDCVMPTRNGRNGTLFTSEGRVNIKNSQHRLDERPLDEKCACYACRTFSRSYLRHLFQANEYTALRLLSLHNITYYLNLMKEVRLAIREGRFDQLLNHHRELWPSEVKRSSARRIPQGGHRTPSPSAEL